MQPNSDILDVGRFDGEFLRSTGSEHKRFGIEIHKVANGLSYFTSGEIPIGQAVDQTMIIGLTVIPTGKMPPNPAELLPHKQFTNCLSVQSPRFDYIIVDMNQATAWTPVSPTHKVSLKEMLPIVDKPLIQYTAEKAVRSSLDTDIFVMGRSKKAITNNYSYLIASH